MTTVFRADGFRFVIHSNDHPPPHVHVYAGDGAARILIGDARTPAAILSIFGMSHRAARRARRIVEENQDLLRRAWSRIHES